MAVLEYLHETFDENVIPNRFPDILECWQYWPSNTTDLNQCNYQEEKIILKRPQTLLEVRRELTIDTCNEITEETCHRVINNLKVCVLKKLLDVMVMDVWYAEHNLQAHRQHIVC